MSTTTQSERLAEREKQIKQAEEILSSFREQMGIAKGLYWGKLVSDWIFPYPQFQALLQAARCAAAMKRSVARLTWPASSVFACLTKSPFCGF